MTSEKKFCSEKNYFQPIMLVVTIGIWAITNSLFFNKYWLFIISQHNWSTTAGALLVITWIILTSFYASFHISSFLFSLLVRRFSPKITRNYLKNPPVAIFYTCMNDVKEIAVEACLGQNYANFDVYILDDSTTVEEQKRIDNIKRRHGKSISILRREGNVGFKAGNLNNALRNIGNKYDYICVVDSDEIIPPTFLRNLVAILEGNNDLGFVQASHSQYSETDYGNLVGRNIDLHWKYFLPARNWFGFIYTYGHGVVFRTQALLRIGGFPEVVSEDIAVSTKLREIGYKGYYAYDIESLEETPPSYQAFRRKNKKVATGTLEFLTKFHRSFLCSENVSLVEKVDLLLSLFVIYLPVLFLFYILLIYIVLLGNTKVEMVFPFYNQGFLLFLLITVFSPLIYLLPNLIQSPKSVTLYILRMGTIQLSICAQTTGVVFKWLVNRKSYFVPTGDRTQIPSTFLGTAIEFLIGLYVALTGLMTLSLYLIAIGLCLMLVPFLVKYNFSRRTLLLLASLPILMTIMAMFGTPSILVGAAGGVFIGISWTHY